MVDALAHVRILEGGQRQYRLYGDSCHYVRPYVAAPIHLTNVVRQPGTGRTFHFFTSAWDPPLEVGQEVIVLLTREEPDLYYGWDFRLTFSSGRLDPHPPRDSDVVPFENGAPVEEVWTGVLEAFRRGQSAR